MWLERLKRYILEEVHHGSRAGAPFKRWMRILYHVGVKAWEDQFAQRAAALSFFTILNLFPFAGILLFILSHSPLFHEQITAIENALVQQLVTPAARQVVINLFNGISKNLYVLGTGISGVIALAVLLFLGSSLILLVERSLNEIFRSSMDRRGFLTRSAYLWTGMTALPIILGLSLALSSKYRSQYLDLFTIFKYLLPYLLTLAGFMVLYRVVPKARVSFRVVLLVSLISGFFWEMAKVGLSRYVEVVFSRSPVGQLYGSLALVPIGMVWIYYSWLIVLLGAELAYVLQNLEQMQEEARRLWLLGKGFVPLSRQVAVKLVLEVYGRYHSGGGPYDLDELASRFQVHPDQSRRWFEALEEKGIMVITEDDRLLPALPAGAVGLDDLAERYQAIFHTPMALKGAQGEAWCEEEYQSFQSAWGDNSLNRFLSASGDSRE